MLLLPQFPLLTRPRCCRHRRHWQGSQRSSVEGEERGTKVTETATEADLGNSHLVLLWSFAGILPATRVLFLIYSCHVPVSRETSLQQHVSSLTSGTQVVLHSASFGAWHSALGIGCYHFPEVWPLLRLPCFSYRVCFLFCEWGELYLPPRIALRRRWRPLQG